ITINLGFKKVDYTPLKEFCSKLNVEYNIIDTNISEIVFDIRKEKNPCSLCANLRRGALNNNAKALGCNKVALGHHSNDAEETLLMSLL
ncbi:MAG TPA: tRNA 2-thiocytidine(32) synthetase TtcA, partial [Clostridiaceae bacterium]|nr:tRNA 2-thiocytidine(32) synthetase TtcA [Clostridiaceae bacterium]